MSGAVNVWDGAARRDPVPSEDGHLGSIVGWSTELFHVGATLLGRQASFLCASSGFGGSSRRRGWAERIGHDGDQSCACGIPVASLLAVLGCRNRQHSVHQAAAEVCEEPLSLMG